MSQRRGIPGRPPRAPAGGAGASNAGARGALLLAVAVILGIVLLQQFDTPSIPSGQVSATSIPDVGDATSTTRRIGLTTVAQATTTVPRARAKAEVKVLVANGAGVRGLGASTTNALKDKGYTNIAAPTDATTTVEKTGIQFAEGYEAEAKELAGVLSLPVSVVTRLASPPVAAADIGDAKVLVILGADVSSATTTAPAAAATTSTTRRP